MSDEIDRFVNGVCTERWKEAVVTTVSYVTTVVCSYTHYCSE
jgi:hypothetical protein